MVSLDEITEPPAIRYMNEKSLVQILSNPLILMHPCHNQVVERHVQIVSEAASQLTSFEKRDGFIRQKIQSRKLLKKFDTKSQFPTA